MKNKMFTVLAFALLITSGSANAVLVEWTDWTSIGANSANGVLDGVNVSVTSTASMNGPSQTGCGTNYWTEPDPSNPAYTGGTVDNAPTNCEQVALSSSNSLTITFDSAIDNLYMAILSGGRPNLAVTYDFDQSFVVDSEGRGYWGNDATNGILGAGDTLTMSEFHGVLLFDNPITSLSFTNTPDEYWHSFTFGAASADVPEPSILALFGLGLMGLGFARRFNLNKS